MGVSASFLMAKPYYSVDRFVGSLAVAAFRVHARIHMYPKHGSGMDCMEMVLSYRSRHGSSLFCHESEMILYAHSEQYARESSSYCSDLLKESKYILQKPHLEYYDAGSIEDISSIFETRKRLLFNLVYEYLKLNPDDLFWVDYDWVYGLNEMERLRRQPFDPNWCYRNVSAE